MRADTEMKQILRSKLCTAKIHFFYCFYQITCTVPKMTAQMEKCFFAALAVCVLLSQKVRFAEKVCINLYHENRKNNTRKAGMRKWSSVTL